MSHNDGLSPIPTKGEVRATFGVVKWAIIGMIGLAIVALLWFGFVWATAKFRGMVEAERSIESGPSRVAFYTAFFDQCSSIQGLEGQIDAQRVVLATISPDLPQYARTVQNIAGLEGRRAMAIARYNQDAQQDYTAARFLDADLPFHLSPAAYNGDNKTRCAAE